MQMQALTNLRPAGHVVLRVGAGILFWSHGAQKLWGWFGGTDGEGGTAELMSLFGAAGIIEFFGGILLIIGLGAQLVALLATVEMIVAYLWVHSLGMGGASPPDFMWWTNRGELVLLYALIWFFIATAGAGGLSVDAMRERSSA